MMPHILIVDDDERIRKLLAKFLSENNFFVSFVKDAYEAANAVKIFFFDLAIIDINMPGKSGFELANEIRSESKLPIIILTARGEINDRIIGLEMGADDYLAKPFEPKELLLRIKNILNRTSHNINTSFIQFGEIKFFPESEKLYKNNVAISITSSEGKLLKIFTEHPKKIIEREKLASILGINERSIDVMIIRLRAKIEPNPKMPEYLRTIRGKGYGLFL